MNEFEIIQRYFFESSNEKNVILGIGDDAAVLRPPPGMDLVVTTDTLVEGVHFLPSALPADIGYKALAVNLSDLAAMGAVPQWALLSLTLPKVDEAWLTQFRAGFFELLRSYSMSIVGGDLTRGPLSITVQAMGFVAHGKAIMRKGARPGDFIYVTGTVGDAGFALQSSDAPPEILQRLHRPTPRVKEGITLREVASAAIDISDGLAADLGHILQQSKMGATVIVEDLPLSEIVRKNLSLEKVITLALTSGDDYELCFTSAARLSDYACIGVIEAEPGLRFQHRDGKKFQLKQTGYQHF